MFLRKILPLFLLALIVYLFPNSSFAVTCCVDHGGEYACDYSSGTLYCKDGTKSTDCTCRRVTPTPTPSPKPTPVPTLPTCVPNSTYDKTLKACKCDSGYIVEGNTCISFKDYCWHNFGSNSKYDSRKGGCVCESGFLWDSDGNSCISFNKTCQNRLGVNSYYNSQDNTCNCYEGYYVKDDECELIPSPVSKQNVETKVVISNAPYPSTVDQEKNITPVRSPSKELKLIVKDSGEDSFVTDEKPQKNLIIRFIENIIMFIKSIF